MNPCCREIVEVLRVLLEHVLHDAINFNCLFQSRVC